MVLGLLKNSTNRLMTPHSMTLSIGGFFSFESNLRNPINTGPRQPPPHSLPKLGRGVNLCILVVAVDGLDHVRQLVLKTIGGSGFIVVGVLDVGTIGDCLTTLGDGFFTLERRGG
jgi:hypothetical protein